MNTMSGRRITTSDSTVFRQKCNFCSFYSLRLKDGLCRTCLEKFKLGCLIGSDELTGWRAYVMGSTDKVEMVVDILSHKNNFIGNKPPIKRVVLRRHTITNNDTLNIITDKDYITPDELHNVVLGYMAGGAIKYDLRNNKIKIGFDESFHTIRNISATYPIP